MTFANRYLLRKKNHLHRKYPRKPVTYRWYIQYQHEKRIQPIIDQKERTSVHYLRSAHPESTNLSDNVKRYKRKRKNYDREIKRGKKAEDNYTMQGPRLSHFTVT